VWKLIIIIGHKSMELLLVFMEGVSEGGRERGGEELCFVRVHMYIRKGTPP
jgi:hypothetical protein